MKANEFKMSERQLGAVLAGLMVCIAVGFLFLLFKSPTAVIADVRVTDIAAEQAAGTMSSGNGAQVSTAKKAEVVNIEGEFIQFEGKPGESQVDWPHFRGTDRSNIVSSDTPLAESWEGEGPPMIWGPVDLGEGHGGAVVWKGRVYVMDYDKEKKGDALRCFSIKDGKEIWRRWYKAPTKNNHGVSRTTPAVTEDYTITIGPRCHVMCVDTETGSFQWGIDMGTEYGTEVPLWYTGQCPLIDGDTVVLAPAGNEFLFVGVDIATGSVLWKTPKPSGKWKMSHSSVMPMTLLGKKMYIYCADGGVAGVSAEESDRGKLLWKSISWNNKVTAPSPLKVNDQQIFLTAGNGGGSLMLELKEEGDEIKADTVFVHDKKNGFSCEQQTPILYEGHIFGVLPKSAGERREQFACINPKGEFVWTSGKTERYGLGPFLMGDGKFFVLNDNGELTMMRASLSGFERLGHAKVLKGHDAWAPMALVDGKLLLRDSKQMICLDVSKQ